IGRFGPFTKAGDTDASLGKEDDPYTITFERAAELIRAKRELVANRIIKSFAGTDVQVLNGRFGPYITAGARNGKIPKDRDPASLTLEECQALLAEGKPVRKGRFGRKTASKTAAKRSEERRVGKARAPPATSEREKSSVRACAAARTGGPIDR